MKDKDTPRLGRFITIYLTFYLVLVVSALITKRGSFSIVGSLLILGPILALLKRLRERGTDESSRKTGKVATDLRLPGSKIQ